MNGYKSRAEQSRVCSHILWQALRDSFVPNIICVCNSSKKVDTLAIIKLHVQVKFSVMCLNVSEHKIPVTSEQRSLKPTGVSWW